MSGRENRARIWQRLAAAALGVVGMVTSAAAEGPSEMPPETLVRLALPPEPEGLAVISEMRPKGRGNYLAMITREAERQGLPPAVADAVVRVESGYDPAASGTVGEVGLMQVRPATAAMLGHLGTASDLFVPETNIRFGVAYLAGAWRLAGGDLCTALAKYRGGHGERRITPRSATYCLRARTHLASIGSSLAGDATPPGAGLISTSASPRVRSGPAVLARLSNTQSTRRLWAEHAERVRRIDLRIARVMSGG